MVAIVLTPPTKMLKMLIDEDLISRSTMQTFKEAIAKRQSFLREFRWANSVNVVSSRSTLLS